MKRSGSGLRLVWLGIVVLGAPGQAAAQQPAPIGGVTGTVALEGTVQDEYAGASAVVVKTTDGVKHVFQLTKGLLVHGAKGAGADALRGLREGSTVVVHYTVAGGTESAQEIDRIGDQGLKVTEGVVTRVDHKRKQIAVRFDNGKSETFRLTERAAVDAGRDVDDAAAGTTRVVVYYSDEAGRKVAHFFRKTS
jgi:hypothetical protein